MYFFHILTPIIPVFLLVGIGAVFARFRKLDTGSISEFIVYLASPALVFTSLSARPLFWNDILMILAGACGILGGVGLLAGLYSYLTGFHSKGFSLPVLFMNSGNMGMPLALFAYGHPGLQRATLFFVLISFLQYSLGVYLLNSAQGLREIFRLPLIYAAALGLLCSAFEIILPQPVFEPLNLLGYSTIPLMLVSLGYRLYGIRPKAWRHSMAGAFIRVFGGLAAGALTVTVLGIEGINEKVILLYSALPSAVINFVLAEKYHQDPDLAASIILLSTVMSLISIPLVLWLTV